MYFSFVNSEAEASTLNHHICLKSAQSVAITGNHSCHKTISWDHLQADHHSNKGGANNIYSPTELLRNLTYSHSLHCGPVKPGAGQAKRPSQDWQPEDKQPWRTYEVETSTWYSSTCCYSYRHKWVPSCQQSRCYFLLCITDHICWVLSYLFLTAQTE